MQLDVIFLDIDGVLNPYNDTNYPHVFAPECVEQLRRILDARPKAHVVFSTSWRTGFPLFALGWLWHQHDLPLRRVIGRTPDIKHDQRGEEIRQWLTNTPQLAPDHKIRSYAVLDDEPEPILEIIPQQHVFPCDPRHGLNGDVADRVIRHFSAPERRTTTIKARKTPQIPPTQCSHLIAPIG
jgi:HAD domain in Swiss Army Knife RNA repair proteins